MSFVTSSTDALLPPKLPGGELQAETSGTVTFTVSTFADPPRKDLLAITTVLPKI